MLLHRLWVPASPLPLLLQSEKRTCGVLRNTCKKCGQFRTAETGHSQYKDIIYCPSVEAVPKEQWLEDIKKLGLSIDKKN